jgi:hypothetical protein
VGAAAVRLSQPAAPLGGGCEGDMRLWSSRRHQAADRGHGRRRWLQWCPGGLSGPSCRVRVRGSGAANFRSSGCLPVCRLCVATNSAFRRYTSCTWSAAGTVGGTASGMIEIGRVDLQFVAARLGTVPLGTILVSTPFLSVRVNRHAVVTRFPSSYY